MKNPALQPAYEITEEKGILIGRLYRPIKVNEFREMLNDMKQAALKKKTNKLLIDAIKVDFNYLTLSQRHDWGLATAEILKGDFRGALIAQKQFTLRHGELVANNRGADVFVTHDEVEAREWLRK